MWAQGRELGRREGGRQHRTLSYGSVPFWAQLGCAAIAGFPGRAGPTVVRTFSCSREGVGVRPQGCLPPMFMAALSSVILPPDFQAPLQFFLLCPFPAVRLFCPLVYLTLNLALLTAAFRE